MIWLRYKKGATTESRRIRELRLETKDDVERLQGRNLRGNDYDALLSERSIYTLEIGADELAVGACRTFMRNYWCGGRRFIALSDAEVMPADEAFIEVTLPGGTDPITYVDDELGLPTVTYVLTEKNAR